MVDHLGLQVYTISQIVETKEFSFVQLKKYVSILFLAVYLLSTNAELIEVAKLPILIEHFREHKQWDKQITFLGFVYMHYFSDDNKYGDQARDMQMPFKTTCHSSVTVPGFIIAQPDFALAPKATFTTQKKRLIVDSSAYSSQYLSAIWQPPRAC